MLGRQHHGVPQASITYFQEVSIAWHDQDASLSFSLEDPTHCPLVPPPHLSGRLLRV